MKFLKDTWGFQHAGFLIAHTLFYLLWINGLLLLWNRKSQTNLQPAESVTKMPKFLLPIFLWCKWKDEKTNKQWKTLCRSSAPSSSLRNECNGWLKGFPITLLSQLHPLIWQNNNQEKKQKENDTKSLQNIVFFFIFLLQHCFSVCTI